MTNQPGIVFACRLAAALPSIVGSFFVVLVLFGGLGASEGLVLLGWLASSGVLSMRRGERAAVRLAFGFRRPSTNDAAALKPVWARALAHADLHANEVDLYIRRSGETNAFAAGARSIAVTQGALVALQTRKLQDVHLVAILVHDLLTAPASGMRSMPL